ncbi:MAG: serine protease [Thermoproteota archaeon]|nr:serine protease [Thermoproteota archaeon]
MIAKRNILAKAKADISRPYAIIGIFLIVSSLLLSHPSLATAQRLGPQTQAALKPSTVAEVVKPAVVRIFNFANITLSSPFPSVDVNTLQQQISQLADQDNINSDDPRAVLDTIITLMQQDPTTYIVPTRDTIDFAMPQLASGSGFIVTPNGYIVTNAHVVEPPSTQQIAQQISSDENTIASVFGNEAVDNTNSVLSELLPQYFPDLASLEVTRDEQVGLTTAFLRYYLANSQITDIQQQILVQVRLSVPGVLTSTRPVLAEVIPAATGQSNGKDVAIIKIEGSNLPTVPLGDETSLRSLDDIIAVGFPGSVDIGVSGTDISEQIEPSVTEGKFSGPQPSAFGFDVLQTSTPISHGNSGGPAVNASGNVVGIATFGTINPITGQEESAFNFLMPVSIAKDFLSRINVQPQESQFTKMYRQALIEYDQQHYKNALDILLQIDRISPGNPYVQRFMSLSQQQVSAGQDQTAGFMGTGATDNTPATP